MRASKVPAGTRTRTHPPMPNEVRHIDCSMAIKQLWDYLDLELTDDRMAEVRQHLDECKRCLPHADFARRFLDAIQATREEHAMPPAVREKVMRRLAESGFTQN